MGNDLANQNYSDAGLEHVIRILASSLTNEKTREAVFEAVNMDLSKTGLHEGDELECKRIAAAQDNVTGTVIGMVAQAMQNRGRREAVLTAIEPGAALDNLLDDESGPSS